MSSYSSTYPAIRPTYQIDFSNGGRIPPNATFSRSDSPIDATKAAASAVHFWSNEKHLSSENLLTPSTPDSSWVRARLTPTYSQTGPYTGANATLHTEQAVTNTAYLGSQNYTTVANTSYTYSVWVKQNTGSRNYYQLRVGGLGTGVPFVTYHLSGAGSIDEFGGSYLDSYSITAGPTGWYKLTMTITPTSAATTTYFFLCVAAPSGGEIPSITGDTGNSFLVFGAQVSSTGESVLNETTTSIHRQYASTLKSVSTAGQPRFEYGIDGQSEGILIESQSTNLFLRSESIGSSSWTKFRSNRDGDVAVAPDGTLTADKLREDTSANATHGIYQNFTASSATAYTVSVYAKADGRSHFAITFDDYGSIFANDSAFFNLSTGATGTTDSDITSSIQDCGGGWFRCIATRTTLTSGSARVAFYLADADNSTSYTGDKYSGVLLWGAMAEASSHCSSYLKTEASTVTRAADSLSVVSSSLFDNGEGALFVENKQPNATQNNAVASITDGGSSNYVRIRGNFGNFRGEVYNNAAIQADLFGGTNDTNFHKQCITFGNNNVSFYVDGNEKGSTDTTAVIPELNTIRLGYAPVTGNGNQHIRRVAVYGSQISETEAAALTS